MIEDNVIEELEEVEEMKKVRGLLKETEEKELEVLKGGTMTRDVDDKRQG